jgi:hypothetical protein
MRTPTDALRSFKKYVSMALGPEWEIRLSGEEGVFSRPFARVGTAAPASFAAHGPLHVEVTQSMNVLCHPVEMPTGDEARMEAARVQTLLMQAFMVGVHSPSFGRGLTGYAVSSTDAVSVHRGHPKRVPLWDFAALSLEEAASELDRLPNDFMRIVDDPSIDVISDPADDLRYAVTATARMSWVVFAAVLSDAMTVQHVAPRRS